MLLDLSIQGCMSCSFTTFGVVRWFQAVIVEEAVGASNFQCAVSCISSFLGVCTPGCLVVGLLFLKSSALAIVLG